LRGLYEIADINLQDNNIYYKLIIDNIVGLYDNLLDLVFNESAVKQLNKKIKSGLVNINIYLGNKIIDATKKLKLIR